MEGSYENPTSSKYKQITNFLLCRRLDDNETKLVQLTNNNLKISDEVTWFETCRLIMSGTSEQQLKGIVIVRKMVTSRSRSSITTFHQNVINEKGLLNKIVGFLDCHLNERLQIEAAWVLANVAAGPAEHTKAVIDAGALPKLIKLLGSTNEDLQWQVVWAIGNIAGDESKIIDSNILLILDPLLKILLGSNVSLKLLNDSIWCLSNLCRRQVDMENVRKILPVLSHLLNTQLDVETLSRISWVISYLSHGEYEQIQAVIETIDLRRLCALLVLENDELTKPVLRVFGNIATGNDEQTTFVFNLGILERLQKLVDHRDVGIKKAVYWCLSNLSSSRPHVQAIIDSGILSKVIDNYPNRGGELKTEIMWVVYNVISESSRDQLIYVIENGGLELLLDQLEINTVPEKARAPYDALVHLFEFGDPKIDQLCAILNIGEKIQKAKEKFSF